VCVTVCRRRCRRRRPGSPPVLTASGTTRVGSCRSCSRRLSKLGADARLASRRPPPLLMVVVVVREGLRQAARRPSRPTTSCKCWSMGSTGMGPSRTTRPWWGCWWPRCLAASTPRTSPPAGWCAPVTPAASCRCLGTLRVRVEIMGSQNLRNVGKSQWVLIMTNPIISTRTRNIGRARV
jgi:hypothetical protein